MCFTNVGSFVEISLTVIKLLDGHNFLTDRPTSRRKEENKHAKVMVLVYNTSTECALHMYEVSLKYL